MWQADEEEEEAIHLFLIVESNPLSDVEAAAEEETIISLSLSLSLSHVETILFLMWKQKKKQQSSLSLSRSLMCRSDPFSQTILSSVCTVES